MSSEMEAPNPKLTILGAAYGPADVTEQVWNIVKGNELTITNTNQSSPFYIPDPWPDHRKSLVIVYQYAGQSVVVKAAKNGETITIKPKTSASPPPSPSPSPPNTQLEILGAVYGVKDVTETARTKIDPSGKSFTAIASDGVWTDGWSGTEKTLVVVYQYHGMTMLDVVKQNQPMHFLVSPPLYILGAAFGTEDVTSKVRSLVKNRSLRVTADTSNFGDPWFGHRKSLVVVYQYGDNTPKIEVAAQESTIHCIYVAGSSSSPCGIVTNAKEISILGAVYGLEDVTNKLKDIAEQDGRYSLTVTANDQLTGGSDPWPYNEKTLVIVYQYGSDRPLVRILTQNAKEKIVKNPTPVYTGLLSGSTLLANGDCIALNAANDKYVSLDTTSHSLKASANSIGANSRLNVVKTNTDDRKFYLKIDEKYVKVEVDNHLVVTTEQTLAADFTLSYTVFGEVRLAHSGHYVRILDSDHLIADAIGSFLESTAFDLAIDQCDHGSGTEVHMVEAMNYDQPKMNSFLWQLTGGLLQAIGLESYVAVRTLAPNILPNLRSNTSVWTAITDLLKVALTPGNIPTVARSAWTVWRVLRNEGFMLSIVKSLLKSGAMTIVTKLLRRVTVFTQNEPEPGDAIIAWAMIMARQAIELAASRK